ncbi:MAG: hypothetical protein ACLVK8_01295, partial [Ruminococcus sp.]
PALLPDCRHSAPLRRKLPDIAGILSFALFFLTFLFGLMPFHAFRRNCTKTDCFFIGLIVFILAHSAQK